MLIMAIQVYKYGNKNTRKDATKGLRDDPIKTM